MAPGLLTCASTAMVYVMHVTASQMVAASTTLKDRDAVLRDMASGKHLTTLAFSEKQVATTDGLWYSVRIMPYRTLANVIQGVVITFVDITATKELEARLRAGG